jgi:hypothetical protein
MRSRQKERLLELGGGEGQRLPRASHGDRDPQAEQRDVEPLRERSHRIELVQAQARQGEVELTLEPQRARVLEDADAVLEAPGDAAERVVRCSIGTVHGDGHARQAGTVQLGEQRLRHERRSRRREGHGEALLGAMAHEVGEVRPLRRR